MMFLLFLTKLFNKISSVALKSLFRGLRATAAAAPRQDSNTGGQLHTTLERWHFMPTNEPTRKHSTTFKSKCMPILAVLPFNNFLGIFLCKKSCAYFIQQRTFLLSYKNTKVSP